MFMVNVMFMVRTDGWEFPLNLAISNIWETTRSRQNDMILKPTQGVKNTATNMNTTKC